MYYGEKRKTQKGKTWMLILLIVMAVWILVASIANRSPFELLSAGGKYFLGSETDSLFTYKQLKLNNAKKDSLIRELNDALEMMKKSTNYQQAVVNVETNSLNMRDKPGIGAEVITQIPVAGIVEVLYYDQETYRIGGEYGKWCKVRYAQHEGWVWGNYIELMD